jgi:CheY-like chemotaxis protein/chromosome segregation ATPase
MVTMPTKVLVFESDSAFAGELRHELSSLGCDVRIVDDGNVGLQQAQTDRPDLVLLSIELPRMNGFSVCNKLKKDVNLKDVPLIIMSSESSDETFDQHKKLRTRAEAYVHKPIKFADLLQQIQSFVAIEGDEMAATGDIEIEEVSPESLDDPGSRTEILKRPVFAHIDPEVDSFADAAFGRLEARDDEAHAVSAALAESPAPPVQRRSSPPFSPPQAGVPPMRQSSPPAPMRPSTHPPPAPPPMVVRGSNPPPPNGASGPSAQSVAEAEANARAAAQAAQELEQAKAELGRATGELQQASSRAGELEKQLRDAESAATRAKEDAQAEAENLKRDLEELRGRLASSTAPSVRGGSVPPKPGGVSSREFLDLRETLSKKDKEILALKTQLTAKEKEMFEAHERSLALEGRMGELEDKVLAKDREAAEAGDTIEGLTGELETNKKVAADAQTELDRVSKELAALVETREQETQAHEATVTGLKAELTVETRTKDEAVTALATANARFTGETAATLARHTNEIEARDALLAQARSTHEREIEEARGTHASQLAEARESHASEMTEARGRHSAELEQGEAKHAGEVGALVAKHAAETDAAKGRHAAEIDELEAASREQRLAAVAEREATLRDEAAQSLASAQRSHEEQVGRMQAAAELAEAELQTNLGRTAQRLAETEKLLGETIGARTALASQVGTLESKTAALEEELGVLRGELDETRKNLVRESSRATRAVAKWDADRASLERAKDALAVALSQLDEAEARPITE